MPEEYDVPATLAEYLPDPSQPVDRWIQWRNSANANTVARALTELSPVPSPLVVDPFCGAGSTAVAARTLGLQFLGVDSAAEAVCVTTAKALAHRRHLDRLDADASLHTPEGLARWISRFPPGSCRGDAFTLGCLAFVRVWKGGDLAAIRDDLAVAPEPSALTEVIWGDARMCALPAIAHTPWIGYTSPPFRAAYEAADPRLLAIAEQLLAARGHTVPPSRRRRTDAFASLVAAALDNLRDRLGPGFLIIEHEPSRGGGDNICSVLSQLNRAPSIRIIRTLRTRDFSGWGPLHLILCAVG